MHNKNFDTFSKEDLIKKLKDIRNMGWIKTSRTGNAGNVGNTLEDLLGIQENNLPIPNAAEWELKTQRENTTSLTTLFHVEPSPRAVKFVPCVLLQLYGWKHKKAGDQYPVGEMSFRQTIHGLSHSDRGFIVKIDRKSEKVIISFDYTKVDIIHSKWINNVKEKVGLNELCPQPYWGFDDLSNKAGTKLLNCFFVQARTKVENSIEYVNYTTIKMLRKFSFEKFLDMIEKGNILVDFDARTGHNHGTKFRMRQNCLPLLYYEFTDI